MRGIPPTQSGHCVTEEETVDQTQRAPGTWLVFAPCFRGSPSSEHTGMVGQRRLVSALHLLPPKQRYLTRWVLFSES